MDKFSKRNQYTTVEKEITIREDAPKELRDFIIQLMYNFRFKPSFLRRIICQTLMISPDLNNFSEYPNIEREVYELIQDCDWYYVYDLIEAFFNKVAEAGTFSSELNDFFKRNGIGWKIEYGHIVTRGGEVFEKSTSSVVIALEEGHLSTASGEIKEAIHDLSRRPQADITGAIQHSLACLECVLREMTGDKKATLGDIIKKNPNSIPKPLDIAIEKIWGFASEQGRHLKEGHQPEYLEAELVVELTATISSYLVKRLIPPK